MKRAALTLALLAACTSSAPRSLPSNTPSPAPSSNEDVLTFAVKGDWGAGTRAQKQVTDAMCALRKKTPFKYVVTTGDNFYNPDGRAIPSNYYEPERCLYTYPGHAWRAVWGNHDVVGISTGSVLGAKRYYSWAAGVTQFFMLDGNSPGDPTQRAWLARELRASRARVKIAVFHQPAYTSGLHTDQKTIQKEWIPLFRRHGVQLVLTGHNHDYEHLKLDGIHYVVSGGGGRSVYPCLRVEPGAIRCVSAYNFLLVRVSQAAIDVDVIRETGAQLDRFSIAV
jgi:predicted phosphodiesterase